MEFDVKTRNPAAFWAMLGAMWLTGSGLAGGTSYKLAESATETAARRVAQETVSVETEQLRASMAAMSMRIRSNEEGRYATSADIKWIREALQEIKDELRHENQR